MGDRPSVESILARHPFPDYRWLDSGQIVVSQWVRMKCQFGCPHYGRAAACPPNTPSVDECRRFFTEYRHALLFHIEMTAPEACARRAWSARTNQALVDLERDVFLAGFPRAFALFTDACHLCEECVPKRADCRQPALARPSATGMSVDVFGTARNQGWEIEVLTEPSAPVNYFAFLLVE